MQKTKLKQKNEQKKLIIIAVILILISALFFAVANNLNVLRIWTASDNEIKPDSKITIDSSNNETLKNKITESKIVAGEHHFVALTADGKVYGWGYNGYGQLAQGNTASCTSPVYMNIDNVVDIASGAGVTYALKKDGTVWSVGYNGNYELGIGTKVNQTNFVQV